MAPGDNENPIEAAINERAAFDAFIAELSAVAPLDADRFQKVEENVADGTVDGDPTWFVRYLTQKQRLYGMAYVESGGDWKVAAKKAGYADGAKQLDIETGPAMTPYMVSVNALVARLAQQSAKAILGRIDRIALKAEERGQLDTALRANVKLGEAKGLFDHKTPHIHINADGAQIMIGSARSATEDEDPAMDAVWREVAEQNGLPPELPERGGE